MSNQELFQAMNMFKEGVRDLQFSRALDSANQQVAQIKNSELDEQKQRAALQQVSNSLVMDMARFGVPATTMAAVNSVTAPTKYSTPGEAAIAGSLMGGKEGESLIKAAGQADLAASQGNLAQINAQFKNASALQDKKFAQAAMLQGSKGPKQQQGDVEFGTNVEVALKEANKLEKLIGQVGNFEVMNSKGAALLNAASYQLAINYAKIVDPASVAREGEVAAAQKYLIPLGPTTRNSTSLAALKKYKETIKEYVSARAKQKNKGAVAPTASEESTTDDISQWLE